MSATTTHRNQLLSLINAGWTTQAIAAAVDLGLPAAMARGARSSTALATTCGAHEPSVVRLLRALVSLSVCVQGEDGNFSLTPTGELLLDDAPDSLSAWATLNGGRVWGNWGRLSQVVRTGQSVRKLTQARDDFSSLDSDTLGAAVFNRAMVNLTSPIAAALVATVDFSGVHRVVDVGGGYGQLLCNLLIAHPNMHGLLFDMAHATRAIPEHFRKAGVAERCELVTGSFFDSVPEGADVYLLKSILHDWDDERCLIILRLCKRAMHPTARLLLVERLAPDHAGTTPHHQEVARADLLMMVANGGCERTQSEYHCLLEAAGLRLVKVNALSGGFYIITVVSNDTP